MKKILMMAFAAIVSMGASAQLISSNTVTHKKESNGYNRLSVSYNSLSTDKKFMDGAMNGFSAAWTKGISVSSSMPLYIETGLGLTYAFKSETIGEDSYEEDLKHNFLALSVPVNLTYKYEVPNTEFKIAPFAGVYFRGNLLGETKWDDEDDESINWFDDYEDDGLEAKRFSFGWQVGVGFEYRKLYLGVSYGSDFNNLIDNDDNDIKGKFNTFAATVGFNF